jgi:undecaprenyl-diphosphatase
MPELDWIQACVLALLQGLTEFLPISSSAHLILVPVLLGWSDQGLAFDVAVHVGTLIAVIGYFRREVAVLAVDWFRSLARRELVGESRLAWAVLIGTLPVGVVGASAMGFIESYLRSPMVIAVTTIGFGVALFMVDRFCRGERDEHRLHLRDVLIIGCAQAIALIPGTSRSGVTITAAMALGLSKTAAARFSFLLSIPVIVLAGGAKGVELVLASAPIDWSVLLLGVTVAAVSAYACIHWFLRRVATVGLMPFVIYRLALGAVIISVL